MLWNTKMESTNNSFTTISYVFGISVLQETINDWTNGIEEVIIGGFSGMY